ncbi:MAG: Membrane protein-like protein [Candidatus Giovannonibacteria bacterium GW2011_GWC2_44_9]|uniref:Membrane protein-like protein n=2 Tax=Candidatus Giovannoniibacteriota TaxID=1752738 RepID=A0A0G1LQY8_9BACT|nr:MAG: Membrane protein-like protein [Candidatus Giovannonibacteria bacterium GW2011_GWA1_44_29]KKT82993.1 MAG: Membrane protein-like protein [Candidatus Giovannonibacteria bacterium GW2011_GWC2_44_9]KKT91142.1 MAG: Membrane protein-like protein [Parcubacteria group bacterium GW2011_GWC1_45_13]KKU29500.1 MAG: Membrane protein-like protein [Candidatus Giovannonibacteria bacterium GW2011_GWB1_46_20]
MRQPIRNINILHREKLSRMDRLAIFVTERVGTMGFFSIILLWTVFWLGWNVFAPDAARFDPYPAFVLWLFISNMIQLFLMPLIMVGQSLQGRHAEVRAEADFEVNTKAEREIETILLHLERQNELILKILNHLENN